MTIDFAKDSDIVTEGNSVDVTINVSPAAGADTVIPTRAAGAATKDADYNFPQVTISNGMSSVTFSITTLSDLYNELAGENIRLMLDNLPGYLA